MKVNIGPYPNRWISRVHTRYMDRKYGYVDWPNYAPSKGLGPGKHQPFKEVFLEKLEDILQTIYNCTINLFLDRRVQKVKVHIDRWDTWSMDHTLAPIILPMLKQLKETKHGGPYVDLKDVPKELHGKKLTKKQKDNGEVDDKHFERWDWVLDEMIYAFDCKANKDDVYMRFDINDREGIKAEQERISNGFRLFGKYYESLWD
jgi:hypothetical protein